MDDQPLLDLNAALARMGGDRALFEEICRFFHEDALALLDEIDAALPTRNAEIVERAAHSLKGLAANFGAAAAVEAARETERLAHAGDWKQLAAAAPRLRHEIERVDAALAEYRAA